MTERLFRPSWAETDMQGREAAGAWNPMPFRRACNVLFSEITRNLDRWSDDTSRAEYQRVLQELSEATEPTVGLVYRPKFGRHEFRITLAQPGES
jgi:hypothetical protein